MAPIHLHSCQEASFVVFWGPWVKCTINGSFRKAMQVHSMQDHTQLNHPFRRQPIVLTLCGLAKASRSEIVSRVARGMPVPSCLTVVPFNCVAKQTSSLICNSQLWGRSKYFKLNACSQRMQYPAWCLPQQTQGDSQARPPIPSPHTRSARWAAGRSNNMQTRFFPSWVLCNLVRIPGPKLNYTTKKTCTCF